MKGKVLKLLILYHLEAERSGCCQATKRLAQFNRRYPTGKGPPRVNLSHAQCVVMRPLL